MATFAIDSAAGRFPSVEVDFMWRRMGQTSESTSREKDKKGKNAEMTYRRDLVTVAQAICTSSERSPI